MKRDYVSEQIGPRKIGGRYFNGYWGEEYTVTAISRGAASAPHHWAITVQWETGPDAPRFTTHATAWNPKRDRIISEP